MQSLNSACVEYSCFTLLLEIPNVKVSRSVGMRQVTRGNDKRDVAGIIIAICFKKECHNYEAFRQFYVKRVIWWTDD